MPEEIIVASWRDMTVSSFGFTRLGRSLMSMFMPDFFSSRLMTRRPRFFSSSVIDCLLSPLSSPLWGRPEASSAV
jgi:hypothetical protein